MARPFAELLESVEAEGHLRLALVIGLLVAVVGAWLGWALLDRVEVIVTGEGARVEARGSAHPVAAAVSGRVVRNTAALGQRVKQGDVLVELDATQPALQLQREQAACANLREALAALGASIAAEQQVLAVDQQALSAASEAARARVQAAEASTRLAEQERRLVGGLRGEGLATAAELLGAQGKEATQAGQAQALRADVVQTSRDRRVRLGDRTVSLARLERERVDATGRLRQCEAEVALLAVDLGLRQVRAPIDGLIIEVTPAPEGTQATAGQRFAAIVPRTEPRLIGDFTAAQAVGRVRPGQRARVRLEAYPWTQHGVVEAEVVSVATEPQNGRVRVELELVQVPPSVQLEHGLLGVVEVVTEKVTPAALLLRAAGQALAAPTSPSPPGVSPQAQH